MFISKERFTALEKKVEDLERREEEILQKCNDFIAKNDALKTLIVKQGAQIEKLREELSKKTISQTTTEKDAPPSFNQIVDEWLNGAEEKA